MARRYRRLERQYSIPSQAPALGVPFTPGRQADIAVTAPFAKRGRAGNTRPEPYVLTQFDARPVACIDFVETFSTAEQTGADSRTFNYIVPQGRTAIIRRLGLRVYMDVEARGEISGAPLAAITAGFQINGVAVDQANNIRVDDAICGVVLVGASVCAFERGLDVPLYFLAPSESTVSLIVTNAEAGFDFAFVAPILTGNLLLSEGVNPTSEPATKVAIPTRSMRYP